jgi:hypothetical protein
MELYAQSEVAREFGIVLTDTSWRFSVPIICTISDFDAFLTSLQDSRFLESYEKIQRSSQSTSEVHAEELSAKIYVHGGREYRI